MSSRTSTLRRMDSYRTSDELPPADQYGEASDSRFDGRNSFNRPSGLQGRTVGFPWRTALVAVFLLSLGLTFVAIGASHFWYHDRAAAAAFLSVGCIALLPGAYASFALVQALRSVPGFELHESTLGGVSYGACAIILTCCSCALGRLQVVRGGCGATVPAHFTRALVRLCTTQVDAAFRPLFIRCIK